MASAFFKRAVFFFFYPAVVVDQVFHEQCIDALFMDPQTSLFNDFFIKNGSHGTIYTFKNYFTTVISVISFQFQQNKSYPNRPIILQLGAVKGNGDSKIGNFRTFISRLQTNESMYKNLTNPNVFSRYN